MLAFHSVLISSVCVAVLIQSSNDVRAEDSWSAVKRPAKGSASAIGGYSAGCVQGAKALPANGIGYQRMRPSRRRFFGHPNLVAYIEAFGKRIDERKIGPILVGDLGQAMGGPSPSGHASHQSGLDVDIWFWHPKFAERRLLSKSERASLSAKSLVDAKKKKVTKYWSRKTETILRAAAADPRVARIFVNPIIKRQLCEAADENDKLDRTYLRKLRPWYGHADHMHVRLHCPIDSPHCQAQAELPLGDGCAKVDWWLDDEAQAERRKKRKTYQSKVGASPQLPEQCSSLLTTK